MTNPSSIQSPIPFEQMPEPSPFNNNNNNNNNNNLPQISENKPCKDQICIICKKWCVDPHDFMNNFISCKYCPQSYHKQCISNLHHEIPSIANCNDIQHRKTKETLRCAPEQREPLLLLEIIDSEFESMRYVYDINDNPIYYHPNNKQKEEKILQENNIDPCHSENIYTRTKRRKIKWKGIYYQIGESIEIKNEPNQIWETNIGIIKEIYIHNEPNTLPTFSIFWYWREKELNHHLYHVKGIPLKLENESDTKQRKREMDHHLYIDVEYESNRRKEIEISMASVLHKVVVCDTFDDFIDLKDTKLKEFGAVYYGTYSFTMENYTKYNSSPFEKVNMKEFRKKIYEMSIVSEKEYNKRKQELNRKYERKRVKEESLDKVIRYFNDYYYPRFVEGDDETKCMDLNIPFNLKEKAKGEYEKKMPLQIGRRLVLDEYDMMMEQNMIPRNDNNDNNNNDDDDDDDIDMNEHNEYNKNDKKRKKRKKAVKCSDILKENAKKIGSNEKKEMMDICTKLGIKRGIHIGITVYGFDGHLEVYQEIMRLIKMTDDDKKWKGYIKGLNSSKLRDIKSKIQSEGKCGRKNEMIDGIIKKLKELKVNYKRNNNQKMEIDDIEDDEISEDEWLFDVDHNHNHNNKKRMRYDGYDDIVNNENKRRKIDNNKNNANHTRSSIVTTRSSDLPILRNSFMSNHC